ncbi:MAG: ABC transporter ATP-binding protein [Rhodocyclaceae bacterium]|nr:ABC transporter ATP-binding protein [Rhodocyclaceae bacterium]MCE2979286.1 energy-coupling factor ABC transporter ATP-binding protein [Betaproteobacteria bacterium]MCA3073893.1 ABC transporter ATP-binding protein [Rhodocyclaceae bacterium]MCA3089264.1 ABC transporter ATP-binding protein [Rhodocyclaceae bacterium]MCA3092825.1 ABC transporter ATP-binding protein [Rhodocyclaceae bacterium]
MSSPLLLRATGLRVTLGGRAVLDGCSITLEGGEACVLTGDNGAGKTTLLRVLAGLHEPDAGTLSFEDRPVEAGRFPKAVRHALQFVPAHPLLFSTSVAANIEYGLRARGVPRAESRRRTGHALDWARLRPVAGTHPRSLSAGETQRTAIARAWVLAPRVMLFDEPTANLDQASHAQVVELLGRLVESGAAVLVAAHDRALLGLPGVRRLHLAGGQLATLPA